MRVFLDANVLFSAAYAAESALTRLWELQGVELVVSALAIEEARRNLDTPLQRSRLDGLLGKTTSVPEAPQYHAWARGLVAEKDAAILAAARSCGAEILLTGDVRHFGRLMERHDGPQTLPLKVQRVRTFLLAQSSVERG